MQRVTIHIFGGLKLLSRPVFGLVAGGLTGVACASPILTYSYGRQKAELTDWRIWGSFALIFCVMGFYACFYGLVMKQVRAAIRDQKVRDQFRDQFPTFEGSSGIGVGEAAEIDAVGPERPPITAQPVLRPCEGLENARRRCNGR